MSDSTLQTKMSQAASRTEEFLKRYIATLKDSPHKLTQSMEYSLYGPGKRIRPVLAVLCAEAVGGTLEQALPAAAAIEMIHCFSLIHDDLPAMDDDDLRRGRPTNHKVYGDALAILAGDALNTMAFDVLAVSIGDPALAITLVKELAFATGPEGMIGGQVLDTCYPQESRSGEGQSGSEALPHLQRIHRMKTGALIRGACRMGGLSAGASSEAMLQIDIYGKAIGLAFQIVDDILDVTATQEQMGKRTGKDAQIGKLTYPSLLGLEESREHLKQTLAITDSVVMSLGAGAGHLSELAHMMAARTN